MKKKKCDMPVEPKKTCEEKCKQAADRVTVQTQLVKSKEELKTKACENKLRQLQAPAPEKKDDTKVDDCTKAKKNLAGEQLVLKALEAAAKDCTCEKPKPPTPAPTPEPVKPQPSEDELNCMWVTEQLMQKEKALSKTVDEMKKKKCDMPVEPKKTCEENCKQAADRVTVQTQLVKSKEELKTKACENKLRQLQAPAPEKMDDTKVDDCTKAKKNLAGEQLVLKALKAAAKDCTCEKPKPPP